MNLQPTSVMKLLGMRCPIIGAPMGGGPTTPELVAEVSRSGGLGTLAAAYLSPEQIGTAAAHVRRLTQQPFAMNLFTPMPQVQISKAQLARAEAATQVFRGELGLPAPRIAPPYHPDFETQFEAVLRAQPHAFGFIFGGLDRRYLDACRKQGIVTIGTATTLEEARDLESTGVDVVAVQGTQAGAHHGIFSADAGDPGVETAELTRRCLAGLRVPVIAAGGLMTGADIAQVLRAGAQAAMLGTAFLLCPEAGTSAPYRQALREAAARGVAKTRLTRAFSGRLARGIENRFLSVMESASDAVLPFPAQNAFTRDIRNKATKNGKTEYLSLWAGTGVAQIREMGAADLVRVLCDEIREVE